MPTRCPSTNQDGSPCGAQPGDSGWCRWHDPALEDQRRAWSQKGGKAKSNRSRARKRVLGLALSPAELNGVLSDTLTRTLAGELEPGIANAAANLSRAMIAVREATETDERLTALEKAGESSLSPLHPTRRYPA